MTKSQALTYASYLALDELLAAQRPRTGEHDELLFIVIHQVYELWFKQLLHEAGRLQLALEAGRTAPALATLARVRAILKTIVAQVDVLETMTPREFTGFRSRLEAASGFQSAQFRELEAVLGRRDPALLASFEPGSEAAGRVAAACARRPVFDSFLRFLAAEGYPVPAIALARDVTTPWQASAELRPALLAAYADEGPAAHVAERLVDVDEGLQEWRYRHVMMVQRTIGTRSGTGGSAGADYLRRTLFRPCFPDLWEIRSEL